MSEQIEMLFAGASPLFWWLVLFVAVGLLVGFGRGYVMARKIQPNSFKWDVFRHEIFWAIVNVSFSALVLGTLTSVLTKYGWISFSDEPAAWWVIALEFTLYFFAFDTYFYWFHRLMHMEPIYTWVHKTHHRSISPNVLTTLSVNPLESFVNGGFVPLFTAALTVHAETMVLIAPVNIIMGLYVHSGFEFFPRWWNKSWLTKWFITATFHDQHHRFFKGNYGGYTTLWDRWCNTARPSFEVDFDRIKQRAGASVGGLRVEGG